MTNWHLLGDTHLRYVQPVEDMGETSANLHGGDTCFVVFSGTLYETILTQFPEFQPNPAWPFSRMPLATAPSGVSIHFPLYGSSRAASTVEQLVHSGFSQLIGIGLCGSITPTVHIGDIVAPLAAIRGDAVSLHYAPIEYPAIADFSLLSSCIQCLSSTGNCHVGVQYSTDALYRETHEQIEFWRKMGALSIDMECSTFFSVSHALQVPACWIGIVSDMLYEGQHLGSIKGDNVIEGACDIFYRILAAQK